MTAASDYHAARPAFQSINEPSADYGQRRTRLPDLTAAHRSAIPARPEI
jgi:hypothetical protein